MGDFGEIHALQSDARIAELGMISPDASQGDYCFFATWRINPMIASYT